MLMYANEEPDESARGVEIDWAQSKTDHFVQWYRNDSALVQSIATFTSDALRRGGAAIVVSTEPHRKQVEERLQLSGLDVRQLERNGRYIFRDAEETLDSFMVNSRPDPDKFFDVVGTVVSRASNSWNGVRAFGEMVGVLWQNGQPQAAVELEQLWHRLIEVYSLPLFCAYPRTELHTEAEVDSFREVCDAHSVVIL